MTSREKRDQYSTELQNSTFGGERNVVVGVGGGLIYYVLGSGAVVYSGSREICGLWLFMKLI